MKIFQVWRNNSISKDHWAHDVIEMTLIQRRNNVVNQVCVCGGGGGGIDMYRDKERLVRQHV